MAKLSFFISTASLVEPFLVEFQSEHPLAPFLFEELTYLTTIIMRRVVKPEVLEGCTSVIKLDTKSDNLLPASKINMEHETRSALNNSKPKPTDDMIVKFTIDCKNCYVKMIKKLQERSPLKYSFTKYISCVDPKLISSNTAEAQKRLDFCLNALHDNHKLISGSTADKMKQEFDEVLRSSAVIQSMKNYNRREERLDKFWMNVLDIVKITFLNLKCFLEIIFIFYLMAMLLLSAGFQSTKRQLLKIKPTIV